uniref:Uncharacterized protein n=1 Tax=Anguilla anguilla TaxID=7936 RepID=A0A0E9QZ15_ANGAN
MKNVPPNGPNVLQMVRHRNAAGLGLL